MLAQNSPNAHSGAIVDVKLWRTIGLLPLGLSILAVILLALSVAAEYQGWPFRSSFLAVLAAVSAMSASYILVIRRRVDLITNSHLRGLESRRADQVSMLSHEIRTPLAVISGSAELLAEEGPGPLTAKQRSFVARILDNSQRMANLAEQLLTQARIEAGVFEVRPAVVDVRSLMRHIVEDLVHVTDAPIVLDAPGAPVRANVDAELIRQVVTNLVMNAARSNYERTPIQIRLTSGEDQLMVSVSDGGSGMTEEQRDRLFSRFSSGRPLGNGTGIGLFISQQVIELHGGRIFVDTITGGGTTMMFTLPAKG
ncbi:sensor histidine kinase [Arthrobacter psychrolactophilus]|uniref:histidine kinase n=1 Tax=Arthrobacter psychrolactophilus TaxID=92442 RepID=A0A2V5JGQ0_9MICC|nr:HAMP domain-containing sensor histidine kinase [Arthrobacter psychrolactophilus]PYI38997.1 sensor histidine kinase [Arthrobacter psychrolactophilus]